MSEFVVFQKLTRRTDGNKVVQFYIQFSYPKFNVRIVVMPRERQRFLCPLQSFRRELHNNWKGRESVFMLLFRNEPAQRFPIMSYTWHCFAVTESCIMVKDLDIHVFVYTVDRFVKW
jgi:hypothetical protein